MAEKNVTLKVAIYQSRLHQYQVAERCGLSETQLSRIILGRRAASLEEQTKIANALDRPVAELFPASTQEAR